MTITQAGTQRWRRDSATRIGAAYRAHRTRRWYRSALKDFYKGGGGDPALRREYFLRQFSNFSSKLDAAFTVEDKYIDDLFSALDESLRQSRQVMSGFGDDGSIVVAAAAGATAEDELEPETEFMRQWGKALALARKRCVCLPCEAAPAAAPSPNPNPNPNLNPNPNHNPNPNPNPAAPPGPGEDCAICMSEMVHLSLVTPEGTLRGGKRRRAARRLRAITLLSCSHTFHERCLRSYEDFSVYEVLQCPMCRAAYTRVTIA